MIKKIKRISKENPALTNGSAVRLDDSYVYNNHDIMHVIRRESNNQVMVVNNFENTGYAKFGLRQVPEGKWKVVLDTKRCQHS